MQQPYAHLVNIYPKELGIMFKTPYTPGWFEGHVVEQ